VDLLAKKVEARYLEMEGKPRDALALYRDIVAHFEAKHLLTGLAPIYIKISELSTGLGDRKGAVAILTGAADHFADAGDAEAVLEVCQHLPKLDPTLTDLPFRYARRMLEKGHTQGARLMLLDVARRRRRATVQLTLERMAAWPADEVRRQLLEFLDRVAEGSGSRRSSGRRRGRRRGKSSGAGRRKAGTPSSASAPPATVPETAAPATPAPTPAGRRATVPRAVQGMIARDDRTTADLIAPATPGPPPPPVAPSPATEPKSAPVAARAAAGPAPAPSSKTATAPSPAPAGRQPTNAVTTSVSYVGWVVGTAVVGFAAVAAGLAILSPRGGNGQPPVATVAQTPPEAAAAQDTLVPVAASPAAAPARPADTTAMLARRDSMATVGGAVVTPTPAPAATPAPARTTPTATQTAPAPAETVRTAQAAAARPDTTATPPSGPTLPANLRVDRPVVIVEGLTVVGVDVSGQNVRVTQLLDSGDTLQLRISDLGPSSAGAGVGRVLVSARAGGGSQGTARIGQYLVTGRAALTPEALEQLLRRLVEVKP
jgi:hypothetical protein